MVRTAVVPAAGLGTRFLPASKAIPKELIPLVDKPGIQWVVEEAVAAGIERVVIVTARGKGSIEDHFDRSPELEAALAGADKLALLEQVRAVAELADMVYVRQASPKGLGHAVATARPVVGDEPFCVLLPDDVMHPSSPVLADMLSFHADTGRSIVALKQVTGRAISLYGAALVDGDGQYPRLVDVVEKPSPENAPSDLAMMGRYVFTSAIFDAMERVVPGSNDELQLTDGIRLLCHQEDVHGLRFEHRRFDIGNKLDYLTATVELALEHPELGESFAEALTGIVKSRGLV